MYSRRWLVERFVLCKGEPPGDAIASDGLAIAPEAHFQGGAVIEDILAQSEI